MESSWPINIFKGGLKPAWLNFLLALILRAPDPGLLPTLAMLMQLSCWVVVLVTGLVGANNAVLLASLDGTIQE